jgi:hypothetical protein
VSLHGRRAFQRLHHIPSPAVSVRAPPKSFHHHQLQLQLQLQLVTLEFLPYYPMGNITIHLFPTYQYSSRPSDSAGPDLLVLMLRVLVFPVDPIHMLILRRLQAAERERLKLLTYLQELQDLTASRLRQPDGTGVEIFRVARKCCLI